MKKCPVRRLAKMIPQAPDLHMAMSIDDAAEQGIPQIVDVTANGKARIAEPSADGEAEMQADGAGTESPPDESGLPDLSVFDPPEPPKCPGCGSTNLKEGHAGVDWDWQCRECGMQFSK